MRPRDIGAWSFWCLCLAMLAARCEGSKSPEAGYSSDLSGTEDSGGSGLSGETANSDSDSGGAVGQAPLRPFGSHPGYADDGVIFPSEHTQEEMDMATADFYDKWKTLYFVDGCDDGQAYVKAQTDTGAWVVSEGQGYGMMIAALMAGHDPDTKAMFDRLYRYYDAHRSVINADLMSWAQGETCENIEALGAGSATDGDMDIAYALLLADGQWGSSGEIDYLAEGRRIIAAILASDVQPADTILLGDWVADPANPYWDGTRSSDFLLGHLKAFGKATGEARWNDVADKTSDIIEYMQTTYAPETGLLPDFIVKAPGDKPEPAPPDYLEGENDGSYSYNACRVPWRIGTDYLVSGDERSRHAMRRLNAWIRSATGDDPLAIYSGYDLDGTALNGDSEVGFMAPFMVSAMIEPETGTNQPWLDALWNEIASRPPGDYYADSLKLLTMLVVSGNWWSP